MPAGQWHGTLMINIFWLLLAISPLLWVSNNFLGPPLCSSVALKWAAEIDCTTAQGLPIDLLCSLNR